MASVFYNLLYFLGIRKCGDNSHAKKHKLASRNITNCKDIDHINSQPRQITRLLYQWNFEDDLSPEPSKRPPLIRIEDEINIQSPDDDDDNTCLILMRFWDNWSYTFFIMMLLIIQPIYTLVVIIQTETNNEIPYLSSFFYQLISPIHYYYAIQYFSTDHFEQFYYQNNLKSFLDVLTYCIIGFTFTNLGINIGRITRSEYDIEFPLYGDFTSTPQILIIIYLIFTWIYSNLIVCTNLMCFCLVFTKHKHIIFNFSSKIMDDECGMTLNEIMQELSTIVYNFKNSIGQFQNIFSSFTFFGAISFGFYIERFRQSNFELLPWNTFVTYIIMQIMFFMTILRVSQTKNGMTDFVKNPSYIRKYVKRYTVNDIRERFNADTTELVIANMIEENAGIIDFMTLNQLFLDDWVEFKFFGFNIANFGLIKKGIVIVGLVVAANSIF